MPLIWCSISAHGFGHAAQVVPVLNELGRRIPGLRAVLRTQVPATFFEPRLAVPWELHPAQQDIGCVQDGPLTIDVAATWAAHSAFHFDWPAKVRDEARRIAEAAPNLVLSDVSPLGIAAGATAGCPTVGMCSLSWDVVLQALKDDANPAHGDTIALIRQAYARAHRFLRIAPGLTLTAFHDLVDIGPISEPAEPQPERLRRAMGARDSDRLVLVGFGGVPLKRLPFAQMEAMTGMCFVLDGAVPSGLSRVHSLTALSLPFKTVLASVDLIVTKPGYGTIVEAVALHKPVVYVRRYNFADEQVLIEYLHRYGRGAELSPEAFSEGSWSHIVEKILDAPLPPHQPPALTGATEAADLLVKHL
ncbi:MAG TPA: hypothetical protein VFQ34_07025 [Nitrospiraceae bacterium]|jgi:hypothetical protein|nr:hypothetical protein [Nitrospiraceae bacterium]